MKNKRDFLLWSSTFKETIANYSYYVDFNKCYISLEKIKVELNILNSLIGCKNIEDEFEKLLTRYPEILKCIPILLAKREKEIFCADINGEYKFDFAQRNYGIEQYKYFMRETGLFDLIQNHLVNNLVDYVIGVEAGLSSNGRQNRGGFLMENLVESYIQKAGFIKNKTYFKEMTTSEISRITGLDISSLTNNGEVTKKFDFVIITKNCTYACECNFYSSSGSKLNETARSYKTLALEAAKIERFKLVWFTDGIGWKDARNNLKETFDVLDDLYSIDDLENDILKTFI